eukprot:scaffold552_cov79-Skeletonema_dohrnii-CCMP3373.AAC.3
MLFVYVPADSKLDLIRSPTTLSYIDADTCHQQLSMSSLLERLAIPLHEVGGLSIQSVVTLVVTVCDGRTVHGITENDVISTLFASIFDIITTQLSVLSIEYRIIYRPPPLPFVP